MTARLNYLYCNKIKSMKNQRRQFLKNTGLATLVTGVLGPSFLQARTRVNTPLAVDCESTTLDLYGQGPFYTPNAPSLAEGVLASDTEAGTRLVLSGRVVSITDCIGVVQNAEIDVWHANDAGAYDNIGFNLRGVTQSNAQGFYSFETILPGKYLNGTLYRPSHIHFKITPPGFSTLITQLYFQGDPYIPSDAAASITSGQYDATNRIIPLITNSNGDLEGVWDIIIDGNGVSIGTNNIHLDKGIIYTATPNPFTDHLEINYGVFQKAKVNISLLLSSKAITYHL